MVFSASFTKTRPLYLIVAGITSVLKVEIDIIASSKSSSPIDQAVILVIMYVEKLTNEVFVLMGNVIMCLMSH